jgi:NAD(P)H-flavin reductase
MAFYQDMPWHEGELAMAKDMRVPDMDNPTFPTLSPQLANHAQIAPLIAIGTLDKQGRPWTTLWGGEKGISQPVAQGVLGIRCQVVRQHDPVVEELVGKEGNGTVVREEGVGRMVSGLTIDLETRKRTKLFGRMIAGALSMREDEATESKQSIAEVQLVLNIEQSLGNCPKYLNKKHVELAESNPELISDSPQLPQRALDLLSKADLFFLSSANHDQDMDTNHRGGPAGFVRVVSNESTGAVLCYPEYSGNRLYQTLGNLKVNPVVGLCVPDFESGDMLYLTGTTSILIGQDAATLLPRSNLAVKITITAARYVATALPFRGVPGESSPYNPIVRYLSTEKPSTATASEATSLSQAILLRQTPLTPTISRFTFALSNATTHKAGQYVTLDFGSKLDIGYSHMRDDDPRSLNDDFVRTFTVSSPPGSPPNPVRKLKDDEFEITVRRVGAVTEELFKHQGSEQGDRMNLEVGVKGFGGEFDVKQDDGEDVVAFVAAGVGITPLLPCLDTLDLRRLELVWTVRKEDVGLVEDVLRACPGLAGCLSLFVTNATDGEALDLAAGADEVDIQRRRLAKQDLDLDGRVRKYYLCTGTPMRKQLMAWLPDKELLFEDFNF